MSLSGAHSACCDNVCAVCCVWGVRGLCKLLSGVGVGADVVRGWVWWLGLRTMTCCFTQTNSVQWKASEIFAANSPGEVSDDSGTCCSLLFLRLDFPH